jgi:hypothetical protein
VIVEEDMLDFIPSLKYVDHDVTHEKKFPELASGKYLKRYISAETKIVVIEPEIWETGLHKPSILNLFDIPHFVRSADINACVKMLLSCVHGCFLWLDRPISIDTYSIVHITGPSSQEEDPSLIFSDMKNEKALSESRKEKFHTF